MPHLSDEEMTAINEIYNRLIKKEVHHLW